jgi:hypothetical protein
MPVERLGFVDRLTRDRDAGKRDDEKLGKLAPVKKDLQRVDPALFKGTRVPEKLLDIHGAHFERALPHLLDLGKVSEKLEPWQANQFNRTLEQFYGTVAKQLDHAPEPMRPGLTRESVAAMREMVTRLDAHGQGVVVPAMGAVVNILDAGVRLSNGGALKVKPEEHAPALRDAFKDVTALAQNLHGREGVGSALNAYWYLTEQLEMGNRALTPGKRKEVRGAVSQFLAETAPRRGFDQALMAHLMELAQKSLAETPQGYRPALQKAAKAYFDEQAPLRNQTLVQLGMIPPTVPAGTRAHEYLSGINAGLKKIVEANRGGPASLFQAVEAFQAQAVQKLTEADGAFNPARWSIWKSMDTLLAKAAKSPSGEDMVRFLSTQLPVLVDTPAAHAALARAAAADSLTETAKELIKSLAETLPPHLRSAELRKALPRLATLDGNDAFRVALTAWPHLANGQVSDGLIEGLVEHVKTQRGAVTNGELAQFAESFVAAFPYLRGHFPNVQEAATATARIVKAAPGWQPHEFQQAIGGMGQLLNWVDNIAPEQKGAFLMPDAAGRPGLLQLTDPHAQFRNANPWVYANNMAQLIHNSEVLEPEEKGELLRQAMSLAMALGHLDGEIHQPWQRIWADWSAILTGQKKPLSDGTLAPAEFLKAYPQLPAELAFTAGAYLNPDQLRWVVDRISATRNKDSVRSLRDFIFACVSANQTVMVDVMRNSKSTARAVSAAIARLGYDFRNPDAERGTPWVAIAAGLAVGGDPITELNKEKAAAGMQDFKFEDLAKAGAKLDPAGLAQLNKASVEIASILEYIGNAGAHGGDQNQFDFEGLRAPFVQAIKDIATGDWPRRKYENNVGKRMLSIMTPKQQRVWRQERITPFEGEAPPPAEGFAEPMALARGLRKSLPIEVPLGGPGLPRLKYDQASLDALKRLRDETLHQLHGVEKGSAEQRELGERMGHIQRNLAVLELQQALGKAERDADPKDLLKRLKPLLRNAHSALKRGGSERGSTLAMEEILNATRGLMDTPRQGRYAADEDGIVPLLQSNVSGCLNAMQGFRRWGLVGALTDANIRMLRVYNGERMVYRGFLKFFPVDLPDYKGPALWLDTPVADGGGTPEDLNLMLRHAIAKAKEMGVPFLSGLPQAAQIGQEMGLATLGYTNVTFHVAEGNTQAQHSDYLFGGIGTIHANRGKEPEWTFDHQVSAIVFPTAEGE